VLFNRRVIQSTIVKRSCLGFITAALLLLWSVLMVGTPAATTLNKGFVVCFWESSDPVSLVLPLSGRGGLEGTSRRPRVLLQAQLLLPVLFVDGPCPPGRPWWRGGGHGLVLEGLGQLRLHPGDSRGSALYGDSSAPATADTTRGHKMATPCSTLRCA
jgi:hypothetical protein